MQDVFEKTKLQPKISTSPPNKTSAGVIKKSPSSKTNSDSAESKSPTSKAPTSVSVTESDSACLSQTCMGLGDDDLPDLELGQKQGSTERITSDSAVKDKENGESNVQCDLQRNKEVNSKEDAVLTSFEEPEAGPSGSKYGMSDDVDMEVVDQSAAKDGVDMEVVDQSAAKNAENDGELSQLETSAESQIMNETENKSKQDEEQSNQNEENSEQKELKQSEEHLKQDAEQKSLSAEQSTQSLEQSNGDEFDNSQKLKKSRLLANLPELSVPPKLSGGPDTFIDFYDEEEVGKPQNPGVCQLMDRFMQHSKKPKKKHVKDVDIR